MKLRISLLVLVILAVFNGSAFALSEEQAAKILAAAPDQATAEFAAGRKVLVFSLCQGFKHSSIPYCSMAIDILGEKTGAFDVDDTTDKNIFTDEQLEKYDVIVFNNTTTLTFNQAQRKAIMDFVKGGKGIVGIHAATDNFYQWPEAAEMMGGTFDGHPWVESGTWAIRIEDGKNPLMKSFASKDFKLSDEIYRTKTINLRNNARILMGLDMSDEVNLKANGVRQNDTDIPISWVRDFGKGRVFYCGLGHNIEIFWNKAILAHYLAGIQFAAGDLKIDTTPLAFDNSYLVDITGLDSVIESVSQFADGRDTANVKRLETIVRQSMNNKTLKAELEIRFIGALSSETTTKAGKRIVCEQLSLIGTESSIGVLARLIIDEETSDVARFAAERIPSPLIDEMLVEASYKTLGNVRIGIVNTLGVRGDVSPAVLGEMIDASDPDLTLAAIEALKRIGNKKAMDILAKKGSKLRGKLYDASVDGYLNCADALLAAGDSAKAMKAYRKVYSNRQSKPLKIAAVNGMIKAAGTDRGKVVTEILKSKDKFAKEAVFASAGQLKPSELKPILAQFDKLDDSSKVQLIAAVSETKSDQSLAMIIKASSDINRDVRLEAIKGLAIVGDASSVKLLAEIAANARGDEQKTARQALYNIKHPDTDKIILQSFIASDTSVKRELLKAMGQRNITDSRDVLVMALKDSDAKVRVEALRISSNSKGLVLLDLLNVLAKAQSDSERNEAIKAIVPLINNSDDKTEGVYQLVKFKTDDAKVSSAIMRALGELGHERGYKVLTEALNSDNEEIQYGAIVGLTQWPNAAAADILLEVAQKESVSQKNQIMAFRGCVALLGKATSKSDIELVIMLEKAMDATPNSGEKRKVLSTLASLDSKAALVMAVKYLDDDYLRGEAEIATVKIASKLAASDPETVKTILEDVILQTSNRRISKQAQKIIDKLNKKSR
jgi:type 1 glutamine amidotransferase/HEAT repeat protein